METLETYENELEKINAEIKINQARYRELLEIKTKIRYEILLLLTK